MELGRPQLDPHGRLQPRQDAASHSNRQARHPEWTRRTLRQYLAALIDNLPFACSEGCFRAALRAYLQATALVRSEVGYLSYGSDAAIVLYRLVNTRSVQRRE